MTTHAMSATSRTVPHRRGAYRAPIKTGDADRGHVVPRRADRRSRVPCAQSPECRRPRHVGRGRRERAVTAPSMALPAQPAVRECKQPASHLRRALALFDIWRQRLRDRRALALMDERSLRDVGLTRCDALYEARKPFWRE